MPTADHADNAPYMHQRNAVGRPACDTVNTRHLNWPTTTHAPAITCCWCRALMTGAAAVASGIGDPATPANP